MSEPFPERITFFCDCNARFSSADSLNEHGATCPEVIPFVEGSHNPTRDGLILLCEKMMENAFAVMQTPKDLGRFLMQVTRIENLRRQGKVPKDAEEMLKVFLTPLSANEMTRYEGITLIEEVAGWYGLSREEARRRLRL
jgi:hypothetical protein